MKQLRKTVLLLHSLHFTTDPARCMYEGLTNRDGRRRATQASISLCPMSYLGEITPHLFNLRRHTLHEHASPALPSVAETTQRYCIIAISRRLENLRTCR